MKKPTVHIWAVAFLFLGALPVLLLCIWAARDGWFPTEKILLRHPDPSDNFYLFNKTLSWISLTGALLMSIPAWILLLADRKPWVWTATLIFLSLGICGNPLMGIPILIFWVHDSNKEYYGRK